MKPRRSQRRGVTLALVLMVMTVVGGMLTLLATCAAQRYRDRQAERVRLVARALTDSAAAYARTQLDTWSHTPPDEPVQLDVKALLPPEMTGSATLAVVTIDNRRLCRVSTRVSRGVYAAADEIDLDMNSN